MTGFYVFIVLFGVCSAQFPGLGRPPIGNLGITRRFGDISNNFRTQISSTFNKVPFLNNIQNFDDFIDQTGRKYLNQADRTLREGLFNVRKSIVDSANQAFVSGKSSYELALNAFSDFTKEEFLQKLTGNRKSSKGEVKVKQHKQQAQVPSSEKVPNEFDWRKKGGVTSVKYQGDCGSCWAFSVTGAIEGHVFRKTGKLSDLSEQNLVDCGNEEYGLAGCDGGFQEYAFEFVISQKGIAKSSEYPYVDKKNTCTYVNQMKGAEIQSFAVIEPKNEDIMKKVIASHGPLACSVNGLESLLLYKRGIYSDKECNKGEVNHSVLVVGYGSEENGQDFWIVKNSWGEAWGEDGYFRLPRGSNFCGIATECSYPIV